MQYDNFDTNLLRTLDALLGEKSVTRAADRLRVSQPAMSGALLRLREYFNDPLLIRTGREMALTALGESLVAPVRATLLQIQSTLATRPVFDPAFSRRKFHVGMSDFGSFVLMAPLLRRLALEAPAMACHIVPIHPGTLGRLEAGDLDLLVNIDSCDIISRNSAAQDLKTTNLLQDDFVCVVDEAHRELSDIVTIDDYKRLPHVSVSFGLNMETVVEQAWAREGLDLDIVATVPSFSAMLFMLSGNRMIATVQRRLAEAMAPALRLKILECPVKVAPLQQILMWHPRSDADPGHRYLRQLIVEISRGKSAEQPGWDVLPAQILREPVPMEALLQ